MTLSERLNLAVATQSIFLGEAKPDGRRICVLLTCFNRRETTLSCLRALAKCTGLDEFQLSAVLVDDGSTDGTADVVCAEFPWVEVVRGQKALFWCRGMHLAFAKAVHVGFDYYLWLNDDTLLMPDSLSRLLSCHSQVRLQADAPVIVVGSAVDAATGTLNYGGQRQPSRLAKFRVERIAPQDYPQKCDALTGNIVLIPADAASRVGNLDPGFEHAMGDTDYGLRARKLGVQLWLAPGVHGHCSANPIANSFQDTTLPMRQRWRLMLHRKGLPWRSWMIFTRRHMGVVWPLYFAWPYLKFWVVGSIARLR
jgi:GT2 family glycosyltransferase